MRDLPSMHAEGGCGWRAEGWSGEPKAGARGVVRHRPGRRRGGAASVAGACRDVACSRRVSTTSRVVVMMAAGWWRVHEW